VKGKAFRFLKERDNSKDLDVVENKVTAADVEKMRS
jgi:hypothetical protein